MARLNEPAAPVESVDAVKRRFLRQNRDLAKCNSNQSVRIRNLEVEGARLLSENLVLKEEVIRMQEEVAAYQRQPHPESIGAIRYALETKLQEFGAIVADLTTQPKTGEDERPRHTARKKAPEERNWRNPYLIAQAAGGDELLPEIAEDKHYPRKTLEEQMIQELVAEESNESPELGPPPVVHFPDDVDPIKFDPAPEETQAEQPEEVDAIPPALAVNLETRKKRRDSQRLELRRVSIFEQPPEENEEQEADEHVDGKQRSKKRKLAIPDDVQSSSNDFTYSRRHAADTSDSETGTHAVEAAPRRKVLGAKSTNQSPRKQSSRIGKPDGKPDAKPDSRPDSKPRKQPRTKPTKPVQKEDSQPIVAITNQDQDNDIVETAEIHPEPTLPPKTPAALGDLVSPPTTEPSTAQGEYKGTPPPTDLNPATDQLGARPSRRARSAVNYAEPSLGAKMRRPTDKLGDAVSRDRQKQGISDYIVKREGRDSSRSSLGPLSVEKSNPRSMVIKREKEDTEGTNWDAVPDNNQEAGSPLGKKMSPKEDPKEEDPQKSKERQEPQQSKSGAAIAALMAGSGRSTYRRANDLDNLAIYDFDDTSSPPEQKKASVSSRTEASTARASRRHSSVASANPSEESKPSVRSATSRSTSGRRATSKLDRTSSAASISGTERGALAAARADRRRSMVL